MSTDQTPAQPRLRALRGATTVERNEPELIVSATAELLAEMVRANDVAIDDIVSLLFTATPDLTAEFPAVAARKLGTAHVPLLCATEIAVPGSVERCVRVLMHLYSAGDPASLQHVYREGARSLRTDLA